MTLAYDSQDNPDVTEAGYATPSTLICGAVRKVSALYTSAAGGPTLPTYD